MKSACLVCTGLLLVVGCSSGGTNGTDSGSMSSNDAGMPGEDAMEQVDEGPPPCEYPAGPYGYTVGKTVPANIGWECYAPGESTTKMVYAKDFFDCDGRFGVNAILFDEAALWCGPCIQEAMDIPAYVTSTAKPNGIAIASLVVQDLQMRPADISHATTWRTQHNLKDIWVCADPGFFFSPTQGPSSLPTNVIVDPRTMKIVKIVNGYGGMIEPELLTLAKKNQM